MKRQFVAVDKWLDQQQQWLLIMFLVLVSRLPTFFEPYWYGDEAIYLTIGNALRHGEKLYLQIVDHKTPIIYYLAMVGSQLNFRILMTAFMMVATISFFAITQKILRNSLARWVAVITFILATSTPFFEGNIPNGELVVMTFVLLGTAGLMYSATGKELLASRPKIIAEKKDTLRLFLVGILLSCGTLTKVPAIFDVAGVLLLWWFAFWRRSSETHHPSLQNSVLQLLKATAPVIAGIVLPIIFSILYFMLRGSGQAYLDFGLLYNFHYVGTWHVEYANKLIAFLFSMPGKLVFTTALLLIFTGKQRKLSPEVVWVGGWSLLSLFGATLSNRPYPHYFQQAVPALALMLGLFIDKIRTFSLTHERTLLLQTSGVTTLVFGILIFVMLTFRVTPYPVFEYYQRFGSLITNKISTEDYRSQFDSLMTDNYNVTPVIMKNKNPQIFIWGTNPTLYALTRKVPVGRFTVAFHIDDLHAHQETIDAVTRAKPEFIVVMKDQAPLPGLQELLMDNYLPNPNFTHFVLWRRWRN